MIGILVWCVAKQAYQVHTFRMTFNTPFTGELDDETYWFPEWGPNPFIESKGYFAPEMN